MLNHHDLRSTRIKIPWSLDNCDGTMKKTNNKAALANRLEKKLSATESVSVPSPTIIDGMSLIHKLPGENRTFSEVSDHLFSLVLQAEGSSQGVDIVFDVYKDQSIKNAERLSRGYSDGIQLFTQISPARVIENWRRILTSQSSKTHLSNTLLLTGGSHAYEQDWAQKFYS